MTHNKHAAPRGGFSILELLLVVTMLGLIATLAPRFGGDPLGNYGAGVDARRVSLDMIQARRRAISTGDNHFLSFQTGGGGQIVGYTVYRRFPDTSTAPVDSYKAFPVNVTVTISATPEFAFDGAGLSAYTITLAGPDRTWQVTSAQATGSVRVVEL